LSGRRDPNATEITAYFLAIGRKRWTYGIPGVTSQETE
jgi:hypothetical protein